MTEMMSLKEARNYYGLTLRHVAAALGVPVVEYWIYEQELGEIPADDLARIAALYGCSINDLVFGRPDVVGDILEAANTTKARSA